MNFIKRIDLLNKSLQKRILVLDGAMGTLIQSYKLNEADFRGNKFENWSNDLKGNNDVLCLTQPGIISEIHDKYLQSGADIIITNSFNSNRISQSDYGLEEFTYDLNFNAAKIARDSADNWSNKTPNKTRFVAGSLGPTNRTASISPKVDDPAFRNTSFEELRKVYKESALGLLDGGVDILILETIFDTLNAKAAIYSLGEILEEKSQEIPIMISGTITDMSGRNLSGQTVEAFWYSVRHISPITIGLNCSFGAEDLRVPIQDLSRIADTYICAYPNAGLPNHMGEYDEQPETTAKLISEWAREGFVNVVGGCCGTTPEHIKKISEAVKNIAPRVITSKKKALRLSGLEPVSFYS